MKKLKRNERIPGPTEKATKRAKLQENNLVAPEPQIKSMIKSNTFEEYSIQDLCLN